MISDSAEAALLGTIKCFGDFWKREEVEWNPRHEGRKLLGYRRSSDIDINFRRQTGIYVLMTEARQIVYVGQVGSGERAKLFGRLRSHTANRLRERWTRFSWFGLQEVDDDAREPKPFVEETYKPAQILNELEGLLIHVVEPPLNRAGPRWDRAREYLQVPKDGRTVIAKADDDDENFEAP